MNNYDLSKYEVEEYKYDGCPSLIDVPVLVLFFNRPKMLKKEFERIQTARPSTLLLYQDGERNESDHHKVEECRDIVNNINWTCKVYRLFQDKNYGCDPSGYMSRLWAFGIVDKCIILEDDTVPSVSFFRYSKEMLDRYEDDKRIYRICGQNIAGQYNPYHSDYFFSKGGSIWGWATWKRVFEEWDPEYSFLNDKDVVAVLQQNDDGFSKPIKKYLKTCRWHKDTGKEYFESIYASTRYLGTGLSIIPSKNMISNIGISPDAVHGAKDIRLLTKRGQKAFNATNYELEFPLRHPQYVLECKEYEKIQGQIMGWNDGFIRKAIEYAEEKIRQLLYMK